MRRRMERNLAASGNGKSTPKTTSDSESCNIQNAEMKKSRPQSFGMDNKFLVSGGSNGLTDNIVFSCFSA
ncbi:hypothetical protein L484_024313 [Morus notabilis]|uniref:Uncharacterized protein n=1 Tax=Morus notabilis TaxID=981085 RepID=W9QH82_9ROSA|nr:hypothetical protein L484_024313 [Morus notabilis]